MVGRNRTTLDNIAEVLGLSKFSVSRALSGKPGVSERTRSKVISTAREMGYNHALTSRPAPHSQRLLRLVIPSADAVRSSFWIEVIEGAESEARKLGYRLSTEVIAGHSGDDLVEPEVAGLLLAGRRSRGVLEPYISLPIPKVLIGHPRPMEIIDSVQEAAFDAGFATGKLLCENHHRCIAYFTDAPDDEGRNLRHSGLNEAMREVDGHVVRVLVDDTRNFRSTLLKAFETDGPLPTAFASATDSVALNLLVTLMEMGLKVPEMISVVGSSDSHSATALGIRMTTVRQPVQEIGIVAMQTLHWRLTLAQPNARPRRTLLTPELVLRTTHGPANTGALADGLKKIGLGQN